MFDLYNDRVSLGFIALYNSSKKTVPANFRAGLMCWRSITHLAVHDAKIRASDLVP